MAAVNDDPVLKRRSQVARLAELGQRFGYLMYGLAIVLFIAGFVADFTTNLTRAITAAMVIGSILLAPAIVASYAVKAAEREDRERR